MAASTGRPRPHHGQSAGRTVLLRGTARGYHSTIRSSASWFSLWKGFLSDGQAHLFLRLVVPRSTDGALLSPSGLQVASGDIRGEGPELYSLEAVSICTMCRADRQYAIVAMHKVAACGTDLTDTQQLRRPGAFPRRKEAAPRRPSAISTQGSRPWHKHNAGVGEWSTSFVFSQPRRGSGVAAGKDKQHPRCDNSPAPACTNKQRRRRSPNLAFLCSPFRPASPLAPSPSSRWHRARPNRSS